MDGLRSARRPGGPPLQLFNCTFADCGATFSRRWKLEEHETVHTGAVRRSHCHAQTSLAARGNLNPFAVAMSVHCCWLRPSVFEEVSPEPPHAPAHGSQTVQVSRGHLTAAPRARYSRQAFLCRCEDPACNLSFFNAGKLKRHARYCHGDKNKYFRVCRCRPCPLGGAGRRVRTAAGPGSASFSAR